VGGGVCVKVVVMCRESKKDETARVMVEEPRRSATSKKANQACGREEKVALQTTKGRDIDVQTRMAMGGCWNEVP